MDTAKPTRRRRAFRVPSPGELALEDGANGDVPKKRRRRTTSSRKDRSSSIPFDSNANPGEELDPTVVTMADICEDTGQGRVSSKATQIFENHAAWKRSNRERRARMRATMEARKYGRGEDADAPALCAPPGQSLPSFADVHDERADADDDPEGDGFDYSKVVGGSRLAARVRIGANGETVIDEASLFVDRTEEHETENYTHVEESDATKFTNSSTYSKRYHGSRWSAEETELFFDALRQFGENYELISYVLPGRDRKSCKNKFKTEDKKNPQRINDCLYNRVPYDIDTLSRMTGKDFTGPTPVIRAKTPPDVTTLEVNVGGDSSDSPNTARKKSRTPGVDEGFGVKRSASASAPSKRRHKGKEDGVEILGAADGVWDD
ncbi:hypothetical protein K488DRAFT_46143 [Vararia minispora EC-137]|uniref:Uncharacterized protein n=1 Tax=Vararia minispora EC-137 TaxID=1314806 RepID=A0ACB8QR63_9AGAM|nr:hypothetical protein K488DRAFT_46143 [Vararia minispora EC-137]